MDHFDQAIEKLSQPDHSGDAITILILGCVSKNTKSLKTLLVDTGHRVSVATTTSEFKKVLNKERVGLVLTTIDSEKITPVEVLGLITRLWPTVPVIGYTWLQSNPDVTSFIRSGGADLFCLPTDLDVVTTRVTSILDRTRAGSEESNKTTELTKLCHTMNDEIHRIAEENQTLSGDLANSYCESQKKMHQVAIGAEFQTLVSQELDIESMLQTALGYMLTRIGALNAVVFLRDGSDGWSLGAYINYDRQEDEFQKIINNIGMSVCPHVAADIQLRRFTDGETFAGLMDLESMDYEGCEVVSFGCFHKNKCMAVMVIFRSDSKPFDTESIDTMDTLRTIFGQQVATIKRIYHRAETHWPSESIDDDDWSLGKAA